MPAAFATPRRACARTFRPHLETLEDRLTPSWAGVPPSWIYLPSSPLSVTLNSQGDAGGPGTNYYGENDYVRFRPTVSGSYVFRASTPWYSDMDTVIGVFDASGRRVGYNDDISDWNTDSRLTLNLTGGNVYYFGVTSYDADQGGDFTWSIDGPSQNSNPNPPPAGGFSVTVRFNGGLTSGQQAAFRQAAARWAQIITGDLPNASWGGTAIDDVLIEASGRNIDGPGRILGQAGPNGF